MESDLTSVLPDSFDDPRLIPIVADDGPGIPENERDAVFQAGVSRADAGTGFGLCIVRQIVEAHDWTIRLADEQTAVHASRRRTWSSSDGR